MARTGLITLGISIIAAAFSGTALAQSQGGGSGAACQGLPNHSTLNAALADAVAAESSGLDFDMWATVVNRDGIVCAVAFSGGDRGAQWPGSRVISAQKANTANAFGLDRLALSTANLYSAVQPGGSLYGLQHSNPVDVLIAYMGNSRNYGQSNDPMVGGKIGGVNVFGGGLGLYREGSIVGGVGVSGDTSCADHMVAWRLRNNLGLDQLGTTGGVSGDPERPDNIIYDIMNGTSAGGFGHPECLNTDLNVTGLPPVNSDPD
ncbi:heme-binding protein [Methylonatrum kenyense]|uniref:GlcG/HbpS family heme-binding protein n=1 Tax=Methylonatrum kenyense TaxID=455253 RepID=UPI0020BE2E88|nr:heme-binding protein [Methylonatrum kenyense]MCK8515039.1 heme-binding protein [Methylonatrum kenyense]